MSSRRPFSGGQGAQVDATSSRLDDASSPDVPPPSVGIELVGFGPGGVDLDSLGSDLANTPNRAAQTRSLVGVAALLVAAFFGLFLLGRSDSASRDASVDRATELPSVLEDPTVVDGEAESAATSVEGLGEGNVAVLTDDEQWEQTFAQSQIAALPLVDRDLLDGLVIAWISDSDRLVLRSLETGSALETSVLAEHDLPPLPKHIKLIGARNATWLVDLLEPEKSGKLSQTVRMVRLGTEIDSYGFISEQDDGPTSYFVGSLWGPSMTGTAETPQSWTTLPVDGTGIVVSSPTAESSSIRGGGLELLPRHVGRVVAASADHVAGVSCDNRLQCVGSVARWDGSEQQMFDANALSSAATVRISPDGARLLSVIGNEWTLFDLAADRATTWVELIEVDSTLTWTPDSQAVMWVAQGTLLAIDLGPGGEANARDYRPSLVSPFGAIGGRLPTSEMKIYDLEKVHELDASEGE